MINHRDSLKADVITVSLVACIRTTSTSFSTCFLLQKLAKSPISVALPGLTDYGLN